MSANAARSSGGGAGGGGGGVSGKTLFAENPATGDEGPGFWTDEEIILSEMRAIIQGGSSPSVTWTVRYAADRSAVGTEVVTGGTVSTNTTTGDAVTVFNNGTIPANRFVWLETPTVATGVNAPNIFHVTLTPA